MIYHSMTKSNCVVQPPNVRAELEPIHVGDKCLTPFYQMPKAGWNDSGDDEVYSMERLRWYKEAAKLSMNA